MAEDGEEYANLIADVVDDHKSKTIKAASANLLQVLCSKYDGLTTHVVHYCIQLINFGISGGDVNLISQFEGLNADDKIFSLVGIEYYIETAFLIFCILTVAIFKNDNLV